MSSEALQARCCTVRIEALLRPGNELRPSEATCDKSTVWSHCCTRWWRLVKDPERDGVSGVVGGKYRTGIVAPTAADAPPSAGCHLEKLTRAATSAPNRHMRSRSRWRAVSGD
jgi:hypothetical protein